MAQTVAAVTFKGITPKCQ